MDVKQTSSVPLFVFSYFISFSCLFPIFSSSLSLSLPPLIWRPISTQERGNGEKEDMGSTRRVQPAGTVRQRERSQKPNKLLGKGSDTKNLGNEQKGRVAPRQIQGRQEECEETVSAMSLVYALKCMI